MASAVEIGRNALDLCWQMTWDNPLFDMFTWCKTYPTQQTYINTITHRDNSDLTLALKDLGMLKAVDGSFEVPTAEAVTLFLLLSVGGSPCDFTLAPAQTPPHTRHPPPRPRREGGAPHWPQHQFCYPRLTPFSTCNNVHVF